MNKKEMLALAKEAAKNIKTEKELSGDCTVGAVQIAFGRSRDCILFVIIEI